LRLVAASKGQQLQRSSISDQNLDSAELEFRRFWMNLNKFNINWSKLYLPNPLNFTKSQKKSVEFLNPRGRAVMLHSVIFTQKGGVRQKMPPTAGAGQVESRKRGGVRR
jgi:hypothetical protein